MINKPIQDGITSVEDQMASSGEAVEQSHVHGPNCHHDHHHHQHDSKPIVRETPKVGRNDSCPCGSGKKFKKCHGS